MINKNMWVQTSSSKGHQKKHFRLKQGYAVYQTLQAMYDYNLVNSYMTVCWLMRSDFTW